MADEPQTPVPPPIVPPRLPEARIVSRRGRAFPWFWIIPIIAVVLGLAVMVKGFMDQGPTIRIKWKNAEGIEAGKTHIKYKNVDIGVVKTINITDDNKNVQVVAEMTHDASKLLVDDTRFWVVRPRIAGGEISGLATLISGAYIGMDVGSSRKSRRDYLGLEQAPTVTSDEPGAEFILHGETLGSLNVGSPLFYRRVQVGQVTAVDLDADGRGVSLKVFVRSPNERFVTSNARFWHASGVDVSLDAGGFKVETQSVAAILLGGIAFLAPADSPPGDPAPGETQFTLFQDQAKAMRRNESEVVTLTANFTGSVKGLSVGAPVEFRGLQVGEVKSIDVLFDPDKMDYRFPVQLDLYPDRLLPKGSPAATSIHGSGDSAIVKALAKGLKAQLRSGNLLTGQKLVALDFFPNTPVVKFDPNRSPLVIPTQPGSLEDLQATLSDIAQKIDKIPFDKLAEDLRTDLQTLNRTLNDTDKVLHRVDTEIAPQLQTTLDSARQTLQSANQLLSSDAPLQQDVREALHQMTKAAESIRVLTDYVQQHPEMFLKGKPADAKENAP
jgi:paraquat-inducible protein B